MKYLTEDQEWVKFYPKFSRSMFVEKAGYFDERPQIHTSITQLIILISLPFLAACSLWFLTLIPLILFGWGKLYINLPIKTGIQDCDSGAYGFNYHDNKIWIYIGGEGNFSGGRKWKTVTMPWELTWVRTSTLLSDGFKWYNETSKNRVKYSSNDPKIEGSYEWLEINKWKEAHSYKDSYDGTTVVAVISVCEMEWRAKWLKWTNLFSKNRKYINIEFDQEVGRGKGSYKGGTIGCSYDLKNNESPYECLKRMERDRKF